MEETVGAHVDSEQLKAIQYAFRTLHEQTKTYAKHHIKTEDEARDEGIIVRATIDGTVHNLISRGPSKYYVPFRDDEQCYLCETVYIDKLTSWFGVEKICPGCCRVALSMYTFKG